MAKLIKILTQNCYLGLPMVKVPRLVSRFRPDVVCLQEVTSGWFINRVNRRGKHTAVSTYPEKMLTVFRGRNVTLSRWDVSDCGEMKYDQAGGVKAKRLAGQVLWTELRNRRKKIRVYNCHLGVFGVGMEDRAGMLSDIAKHASKFTGPVIICGDMNTMMPELRPAWWLAKAWARFPYPGPKAAKYSWLGEKYYFQDMAKRYGFDEVLEIDEQTWRLPFAKLNMWRPKLDWMLYRGLEPVGYELGPWIGDHRGIIATMRV
jgi:hypothetical protein